MRCGVERPLEKFCDPKPSFGQGRSQEDLALTKRVPQCSPSHQAKLGGLGLRPWLFMFCLLMLLFLFYHYKSALWISVDDVARESIKFLRYDHHSVDCWENHGERILELGTILLLLLLVTLYKISQT